MMKIAGKRRRGLADRSPGKRGTGPGRWQRLAMMSALLALGLALWAGIALAAVVLADFSASPEDERVRLDWETTLEQGFSGFYVLRSPVDNQNYASWERIFVVDADTGVTVQFIGARATGGAVYHFRNQNLQNGQFYCYALEALNTDQSVNYFPASPACVTVGQPTPTTSTTPDLTTTTTPGVTPTPTRTITPLPLPATVTPAFTRSPTAPATALLTPTGTVQGTSTFTPTPLPTFLPTLTPTETRSPTPSLTPTVTPTGGSLLESTRQPGTTVSGIAGGGSDPGLTLRTIIVRVVALSALVGGLFFAVVYFVLSRRWEEGNAPERPGSD